MITTLEREMQKARKRILRLGGYQDGEDLYQEVYIALAARAETVVQPALISCIARRKSVDLFRRALRHRHKPLSPSVDLGVNDSDGGLDPAWGLQVRERNDNLRSAIGQLSPKLRQAIEEVFLGNEPRAIAERDLARHIGKSIHTVRTRVKLGLAELRRLLINRVN